MDIFKKFFSPQQPAVESLTLAQVVSILSSVKEAVVVCNVQKNIVLYNASAQTLLNLSEQHIGFPIQNIFKLQENNTDVTDAMFAVPVSKDNIRLVSISNPTQKELVVEITVVPIYNGWSISLRDMSVNKQLEEMKLGFVSIAAHELRTPLTSIKGLVSVFVSDYKDTLNADQKTLLERMGIEVNRLLELVENLLNVSRVERGALVYNPQGLDWVGVIREVVAELDPQAKTKHIQLRFIPPSSTLPNVKADKVRVVEVLSNLLSNAITYTSPQGTVDVALELGNNELITHITDTGKGIAKEAIPHLFTKFYRVTDGLNQNEQGTGLGLYISKAIIDMHKGKIWVTSEVGKGSVFSFSLPVV